MKCLAVLAAPLLLAGCSVVGSSDARETAETAVSPCEPVIFEDTPFTHCTADPRRHRIRTVLSSEEGSPYRSLAALAAGRSPDAPPIAFAMNGGMYDAEGFPVGYYVEGRERLQTLNTNDGPGNFHLKPNGVFFGGEGEWQVFATARFVDEVDRRPAFGTQSGPMLVIGGELHPALDPDGESLRVRNAVGVDDAGRAHFVISEVPVSFGKLARLYRDVLKTREALFLDGNVSQLWDPVRGRLDTGPALGPLIVVEIRANGAS